MQLHQLNHFYSLQEFHKKNPKLLEVLFVILVVEFLVRVSFYMYLDVTLLVYERK